MAGRQLRGREFAPGAAGARRWRGSELNCRHCIVGEPSDQLRSRAGHDYPRRLPHRVRIAAANTHNSHAIGPSFPGEGRFEGFKNPGVTRPTDAQLS